MKIKQSTILLIAGIVALFIHSYRLLQLFGFGNISNPEFTTVTVSDWIFRFVFMFFHCWVIMQFNIVWLDKILQSSIARGRKKWTRIVATVLGNIFILHFDHYIFTYLYELIFGLKVPDLEQSGELFGWYIVLIALLLIIFIVKLQLKSKNDAIEKEQLKQEKTKSELVAIKNQVNPHFLFNSLNTLNSVIRNNPENATDFVDKLSFMYRYILQSSEKGLVTLAEELEFLNSYVYLINIRYGNRFELKNDLNLDTNTVVIPVLSLQLLVENTVKHNEISESNPLIVNIYNDRNYISVENEIKPRTNLEESTEMGF
ncbi:MAG: histidine kinase [Flavobacteriaceae bacterium]|nr:histidine kinase [Flavobacteriaceae bacterium]